MRRLTFWHVALAGLFLCVLLMNVFSIPAHDELAYAFMGESTPGRLRWMFPSETKYAILPYNPFTFTAKDGNPYTVCLLHQPICRKTLGGSQQ